MKISVITICYNSARHIEKTITSVLGQSYRDLEYVIVDGGSRDGTVEIVAAHAARDPRIRWVSEPDGGISDAMNKGARLATGEVIAHLHSDEYYLDGEVISEVATLFRDHPERVWLTGGFHFVDECGRFLREIKARRYFYRRLIHSNIILHPATFTRRSAFFAAGGFDLSLQYCMDYHLWLRLGALGDPLVVKRALACFCVHGGSRSTMEAAAAFAEEFQVRRRFLKGRGAWLLPYLIEYHLRKQLNRLFIKRLIASAGEGDKSGVPSC
ncbi:MAG: glycosyltransferase [Geobacter sp.]|nr:MAG: glycosyltransferase [Geobacter sp.]